MDEISIRHSRFRGNPSSLTVQSGKGMLTPRSGGQAPALPGTECAQKPHVRDLSHDRLVGLLVSGLRRNDGWARAGCNLRSLT
jgi:hypothetical protein